jgi:hypothetical protein
MKCYPLWDGVLWPQIHTEKLVKFRVRGFDLQGFSLQGVHLTGGSPTSANYVQQANNEMVIHIPVYEAQWFCTIPHSTSLWCVYCTVVLYDPTLHKSMMCVLYSGPVRSHTPQVYDVCTVQWSCTIPHSMGIKENAPLQIPTPMDGATLSVIH